MATLVDTNVLIDVAVRDPVWLKWSRPKIETARKQGSLVINQIIYAEFSIRYETIDDVDDVLPEDEYRREGLPFEAAFAASRAFSIYRRQGGSREKIMPNSPRVMSAGFMPLALAQASTALNGASMMPSSLSSVSMLATCSSR